MSDTAILVGALTAATALASSWLTARGTARAAALEAGTAAKHAGLREQRERRRSTYREVLARINDVVQVCWRIDDADRAPDEARRDELLLALARELSDTWNDLTRATREVLLDGPAEVSAAAEEARNLAQLLPPLMAGLVGDDPGGDRRTAYDAAYGDFRDAYLRFIEVARTAIEVEE